MFLFYILVFWPQGIWDLTSLSKGSNPHPWHWKVKSSTELPGKSLIIHIFFKMYGSKHFKSRKNTIMLLFMIVLLFMICLPVFPSFRINFMFIFLMHGYNHTFFNLLFFFSFYTFKKFAFWPYTMWFAGSQFPNQGLNPGNCSESTES